MNVQDKLFHIKIRIFFFIEYKEQKNEYQIHNHLFKNNSEKQKKSKLINKTEGLQLFGPHEN